MRHDHTKHILLMLICCLVPLGLIMAISVFGFSLGALQPLLPYVAGLLCPLMMIFMMRGMIHDHAVADTHQQHTVTQRLDKSSPTQLVEAKAPSEQKSCH